MHRPDTRYARNGDIHLAFQVFGEGPVDVVFVPGFVSHLEDLWELPAWSTQAERLARFARVIRFDKRGTGLSDRDVPVGTLEERMDDVRAVMDAAGSERAALVGVSEGGPLCLLFAATHAARTRALVLAASWARLLRGDDYSIGLRRDRLEAFTAALVDGWGTGNSMGMFFSEGDATPSTEFLARLERHAASPGAIRRIFEMIADTDVTSVLSTINVPTLVLHSPTDQQVPIALGRYIADHVRGAVFTEITGGHGEAATGDVVISHVEIFVTGDHEAVESDRVLATVLFTDIVDSTARATAVGDATWHRTLDRHDELVTNAVSSARGRVVKHTGDGVLAAFDGPARSVKCAHHVIDAARSIGLEVRAGLHTGECEVRGDDLGGIAVHVGARVAALARPSEVLVTRTVKDLVAGAGLRFTDRGEHELKGVPDRWQLYASEL
jgi:class 3 adenylate cyclase/pimeloyl-ACP methyl ester carboxylesterase